LEGYLHMFFNFRTRTLTDLIIVGI